MAWHILSPDFTGDLQFNDANGAAIESKRFDYVSVIKAYSAHPANEGARATKVSRASIAPVIT